MPVFAANMLALIIWFVRKSKTKRATKYYTNVPFTDKILEALLEAEPEIEEVADKSNVATTGR